MCVCVFEGVFVGVYVGEPRGEGDEGGRVGWGNRPAVVEEAVLRLAGGVEGEGARRPRPHPLHHVVRGTPAPDHCTFQPPPMSLAEGGGWLSS